MIGLHIAPLAGAAPQPWRNGGGVTRELLAWPPQTTDWALRISVAQIDRDGPFSSFAGVERWFAVVHGAGVRLHLDGRDHTVTPRSEPLRFDGAAAPGCTLIDGATVDLNLMLRRDAGHGTLQRALADADWRGPATLRGLYCSGPARLQIDGRHAAELAAAALVWHPHAAGQAWRLHPADSATLGWYLSFQPHDQPT